MVGNCIGKRNYRFFVSFLGSAFVTLVMLIANVIILFLKQAEDQVSQTAVVIVVSVIAGVIFLPLFFFFGFHLFLAITGNTTRQYIKDIKTESNN